MADGLSPLRYSKFRRVWIGQLANITGDGVYPVAIALFLLPRHEAAQALGTVLAATSIGAIVLCWSLVRWRTGIAAVLS
jgi:hypothetical protein